MLASIRKQKTYEPKEVEDPPVPITDNGLKMILINDKDRLSLRCYWKEKLCAMCCGK